MRSVICGAGADAPRNSVRMRRPDKYHQLFHTSPMVDEFGDASGFSVVEF